MSNPSAFVHLQLHSEYSLLDGAIRIKRLVNHCKEHGISSVALTDTTNLFGAIDFYFSAKKAGIHPIIGAEVFITEDMTVKHKTNERLVLLCQNLVGYQNLCHILTAAHMKGFYYNARADIPLLKKHAEGLIAISHGYWGPVAQLLQLQFIDKAAEMATVLSDVFPNRFYLGIQRTEELGQDQRTMDMIAFAKSQDLPIVALNDVYFLHENEGWMQDLLQCIKTGREIEIDDQNNSRRSHHFMRSEADMLALFQDVPDACENTVKIAQSCQLELVTDQVLLPHFECPNGMRPEAYLEELVWKGIHDKYSEVTEEIRHRVQVELTTISDMQYPIYFLIIYDFLAFCDQAMIPVGPGRGSAAGSIVAYALNITRIDPMAYQLLFERFLNPERVTMPDIDIDFCIKRRSEVIDYISKKYGSDRVAQIVTFGTMAARGVVRDVGRALGVPLDLVDRMAKLIPSAPGQNMSIKDALQDVSELNQLYQSDAQAKQVLDYGQQLEGFARHSSTHAAGVVISRDPLATIVPLINNDGQATTHYSMTNLESLGLLKMDILGLRNLTVIQDACDLIREKHSAFNLANIPMDDSATYALLCSGETVGVFQCESPGMRRLIIDLKPQCFEDIIALLALYRPGPLGSGMVNDFISNKSGQTTVTYDLPELEPILKDTYGMIVYQEQVMQIASVIGGFSLGESDMLRRAMGKKKKSVMDQMRQQFLTGATQKKIDVVKAEKIFDLCYKFAEYGFNKSHSAAYAFITYQTAYLKAHYPNEYMVALLNSVLGNTDRLSVYFFELKRLNIPFVIPCVNQSLHCFHLRDNTVYFGLGSVKGVGEQPVQDIITERLNGPFTSMYDFFHRLKGSDVNKRVVEHLIKAGAFAAIESNKNKLLGCYEPVMEKMHISSKHQQSGMIGLFESLDEDVFTDIINGSTHAGFSELELLKMEKDLVGDYLTAHPLDQFLAMTNESFPMKDITIDCDGQSVTVIGILSDVQHRLSKSNQPFSKVQVEDFTSKREAMAFRSNDYEQIKAGLLDGYVVKLQVKIRAKESDIMMMIESVEVLNQSLGAQICHVDIVEGIPEDQLHRIKHVCCLHRGATPLFFHVNNGCIQANKKYWIKSEAIPIIREILGEQNVWMEH